MALSDCFSSVSEAMDYFMPVKILGSHKLDEGVPDLYSSWVFWSSNPDENSVAHCSIEERIRRVLIKPTSYFYGYHTVVQFWAVEGKAGSKCILTTTTQPFSIDGLTKCYYSYRKECMRRTIDVGPEADGSQLGPAGRAFRNRSLEFSPDIRSYTYLLEWNGIVPLFPLRDYAIRCGGSCLVSLPVFDLVSNNIVGVLEFLCQAVLLTPLCEYIDINVKEVGLRINYNGSSESKAITSKVHDAAGGEAYPLSPQENNSGIHIADYRENISSIPIVDGTEATTFVIRGENTYDMPPVAGTESTTLDIQDENIYDMPVADGIEATPLVSQGEIISGMNVAVGTRPNTEEENNCSTNPSTSQMEGNKFHISLDELKLQFGKPLNEVAKILGVSRSTLKRIRKSYGIHRWPSHKKNKVNQSLFMKPNPSAPHIVEDTTLGSSEAHSVHTVLPKKTCILSSHDLQTVQHQAVSYVSIKASYGPDAFMKFKLNTRSTFQDLQEQVTERLKWDANNFEIKYHDEAKDWITIFNDEDFKECLRPSIDRCETTVSMSINLRLQNVGGSNSKESELQPHKGRSQNHTKRLPSSFDYTREKSYDGDATIKFDPTSTIDVHAYGGHGCAPELVSIKNAFTPFCVGHHLSCFTRFPSFLTPYIVGWLNVEEDGHCGFRAVARHVHGDQEYWMRVRQELVLELDERATLYDKTFVFNTMFSVRNTLLWWSPIGCGNKNWMNSDMGFMIATRYNKVFVLLSESSSQTYLPLTQDDSMPIDGEIVVFHSNDHFIALKMSMNFPLPPVPVTWPDVCTNSVSELPKFYQSRLTKYLEIRGPPLLASTPIMID